MFHHSLKDTVEDASPATSKAFVSALAWSDVRGVLLAASSLGAVQAFVEA